MHITERVLYTEVKRKCSVAKTNLESLLLERLLFHLCELARARRRKGSLPRLCGERVLLRVIDTLRLSGLVIPHQIKRRASTTQYHRTDCQIAVRTGHYFITQMHPVGERSSTAPYDSGHGDDAIASSGEAQGHVQEPF